MTLFCNELSDIEVKAGEPFDVNVGKGEVYFLSAAMLGKTNKKTKSSVRVEVSIGKEKVVVAHLHPEKWLEQELKLVIGQSFRISHTREHGSVWFSVCLFDENFNNEYRRPSDKREPTREKDVNVHEDEWPERKHREERESGRERDRERDRERESGRNRVRERDRERDRERESGRNRVRERERERDRERESGRNRVRERDRERDWERESGRNRVRERVRERDWERDRERDWERDRERDRERSPETQASVICDLVA